MAKRKQTTQKRRLGCGWMLGLLGICLVITVAFSSNSYPRRQNPTGVSVGVTRSSRTPTSTRTQSATKTPTPRRVRTDQAFTVEGNGVRLSVERIEFQNSVDGSRSNNGILAVFYGTFSTEGRLCVTSRDIGLILNRAEYEPDRGWMYAAQGTLGEGRNYPGPFSGHCLVPNEESDTFFVFDVPPNARSVQLRFYEEIVSLNMNWGNRVALAATETMTPTLTLTPTATHTPENTLTLLPTYTPSYTATSTATPTERPTEMPTVTNTGKPTVAPSATPAAESDNQSQISEQYDAMIGVSSYNLILSNDVVYVEADVERGYETQQTANLMFIHAKNAVGEIEDFTAILNDEIGAATSFQYSGEDWTITELEQIATVAATLGRNSNRTSTPVFTPQRDALSTVEPATYYATGSVNLRSCPRTTCNAVGALGRGEAITVNAVINGDAVNAGNAIWYRINRNGAEAFVYSGLVSKTAPVVTSGNSGGGNTTINTNVPGATLMSTPLPAPSYSCAGDLYNCSDFEGNLDGLMDYWNACPGDPSNLDGNPADGTPCNSLWR